MAPSARRAYSPLLIFVSSSNRKFDFSPALPDLARSLHVTACPANPCQNNSAIPCHLTLAVTLDSTQGIAWLDESCSIPTEPGPGCLKPVQLFVRTPDTKKGASHFETPPFLFFPIRRRARLILPTKQDPQTLASIFIYIIELS